MPLTVVTGYARYRVLADLERGEMRGGDAAGIVAEAVRGIHTVATLGIRHIVCQGYNNRLEKEMRSGLLRNLALSFLYAFSQSVTFFVSALLFCYGGTHLITSGEYTVRDFLICFVATTYSAQSAGGIFSFAPEIAGAQEAAARLQSLVGSVPAIDAEVVDGESADGIVGNIELSQVNFSHSTPDLRGEHRLVLDKASFNAPAGSFVALVGASGSGKTTALGMLERFYDPASGHVLADNLDIRRYRLRQYRSQLALVDQDATLYSGTIRDNIITESDADQSAIEQECREANIWEFVESLPDGLDTRVGPRGDQVSGGQKQRLAIARALLRRPKILLLDEATSSLDSNSEAAVHRALQVAAAGRTTIAVAHRLSSVQHADCIYVLENGKVIEQGTHEDLMARKGRYWEYARMKDLAS